jgi:hypothetical protein
MILDILCEKLMRCMVYKIGWVGSAVRQMGDEYSRYNPATFVFHYTVPYTIYLHWNTLSYW